MWLTKLFTGESYDVNEAKDSEKVEGDETEVRSLFYYYKKIAIIITTTTTTTNR
jgi:hypothetical protein